MEFLIMMHADELVTKSRLCSRKHDGQEPALNREAPRMEKILFTVSPKEGKLVHLSHHTYPYLKVNR